MRTTLAVLCAMTILGSAAALSQPEPAPPHAPPLKQGRMQFMEKMGLTEKQKADIAGLRADMEKSMVGIQAKIKLARIDMRTIVSSDTPDKSAIETKMKEVTDLQFQAKKVILDHLFAVYALLTPEQKKMFKDHMMARLEGGMRRMGGRGMGFR
jgi:Spy/CpxP family protein refolding chaperone